MEDKEWFCKSRHINDKANMSLAQLRGYQERQWDDGAAFGALPAWSKASPAMRGGSLFFLLLEVFKLGWQLKEGIENAFPEPTRSPQQRAIFEEQIKLKQLMKEAEAIGGVLIPVLHWSSSEEYALSSDRKQMETAEWNRVLFSRFTRRVTYQYQIMKKNNYSGIADLMQKTQLSAIAAAKTFDLDYAPYLTNPFGSTSEFGAIKIFDDWVKANSKELYAIAAEAEKEATQLRLLAVQPDPDPEEQAHYRRIGFRWRNIPR